MANASNKRQNYCGLQFSECNDSACDFWEPELLNNSELSARSCLDHNHTNSYDLSHLRQFQQSNTFVAKGESGSECKEATLYLRVDLN